MSKPSMYVPLVADLVAQGVTEITAIVNAIGASRDRVRDILRDMGLGVNKYCTPDTVSMWEQSRRRDQVLVAFELHGPQSVSEIAERVGATPQAVRCAIYDLERDGCVRRTLGASRYHPKYEAAP